MSKIRSVYQYTLFTIVAIQSVRGLYGLATGWIQHVKNRQK